MSLKNILILVVSIVLVMGFSVILLWNFGKDVGKPIDGVAGNRVHVKGSGVIEIVEFSDFQCPACAGIQEPLKEILNKYEGKVTLVYRHFPLTTIHQNAMVAAYAASAASLQGKFWEMHDILFERQNEWEDTTNDEYFKKYALEIGIDPEKMVSDMSNSQVREIVQRDSLDATRYRLAGTPSFFVNGVMTSFEQLEAKIIELSK